MSNAMQQCLELYNQASANVMARKASPQDELIVALWEQVQEQEAIITAMNHKIEILEASPSVVVVPDLDKMELMDEAMHAINKVRYNIH